ncbi:MAG: hypothetical protein HWN65_06865 [Candidatus Helarchaeota archaeon]|nr:hypothetical protein [Candidatus Helarchaeota archaeon]
MRPSPGSGHPAHCSSPFRLVLLFWRPEGSYPAMLKEIMDSYSFNRRDCSVSNGAWEYPRLVRAPAEQWEDQFPETHVLFEQ